MYVFIRVCRKYLLAWHVLLAQCYVKILFRLVIGTMVLGVGTPIEKEVLKEEIRVDLLC